MYHIGLMINFILNSECPPNTFQIILSKIKHLIEKQDSMPMKGILPDKRLAVCLYYFKSGNSYASIGNMFEIGKSTVCGIVKDVCSAIIQIFLKEAIKFPTSEEERKDKSKGFWNQWQFPKCLGAIDGSHIPVLAPSEDHKDYYNYKGWHFIILLAVADFDYRFTYVNVGYPGRVHDAGVYQSIELKKRIEEGLFPAENHSIGDGAFRLSEYLLKPYPGEQSGEKKDFNYRLSRARMVIECAFGRLKGRWRILRKQCEVNLVRTSNYVLTCCILHNICEENNNLYREEWNESETEADENIIEPEYLWDPAATSDKRAFIIQHLNNE